MLFAYLADSFHVLDHCLFYTVRFNDQHGLYPGDIPFNGLFHNLQTVFI